MSILAALAYRLATMPDTSVVPVVVGKAGKRLCTVVRRHSQGWDRVQRLMTEDRQGDWWNSVVQARGGCRAPSAPGTMLFLSLPLAHFHLCW